MLRKNDIILGEVMNKNIIYDIVNDLKHPTKVENTYVCPFCGHKHSSKKKKFAINFENLNWHCWICNTKGKSLTQLYYKLNVYDNELLSKIKILDSNAGIVPLHKTKNSNNVSLPKGFFSLRKNNIHKKLFSKNLLIEYLQKRNITMEDIERYNIGITNDEKTGCETRLIIPSYNELGVLNYYTARDYVGNIDLKYLNPKIEKLEQIIFENLIDFDYTICLVEGVFDAITLRRNAIPLLGKTLSKKSKLFKKIIENRPTVIVFLDKDAFNNAIEIAQLLIDYNIEVILVDSRKLPDDKDINDIGFEQSWKLINESKKVDNTTLFQYKIESMIYGNKNFKI